MRPWRFAALAGLVLAACGGPDAAPRLPGKGEAAPTLATLADPASPATERLRAGDLEAARAAYEAALSADPDRMGALNDLAVSYYLEGRVDAARQLLDEVVARGGSRAQLAALVNLGELCALDGYVAAARAYFESARGVDGSRPEPLYALGLLADVRGDAASSLALVREAMRRDESGAARAALAFAYPEERQHLDALVAEALSQRDEAAARWRELRAGRFPALAAAARAHLAEP